MSPRSDVASRWPRVACAAASVFWALGLADGPPDAHAEDEPVTYSTPWAEFEDGNPYTALFLRIHADVPAGSTVRIDIRSPDLKALIGIRDVLDGDGRRLAFDERIGWAQDRVDQVPVLAEGGVDLVFEYWGDGTARCDAEATVYAHPARFARSASGPVWLADDGAAAWDEYGARLTDEMDERGRPVPGFAARALPRLPEPLVERQFHEPDPMLSLPRGSQSNVLVLGSEFGREFADQRALRTIHAQNAAANAGSGVVIAVLDTGIDAAHPVFAGRLEPGFDFVDDDDDPSEDAAGSAGRAFGHGTFVAGLALGVAPAARILPVRVLDGDGSGSPQAVAAGVRWAVDRGARVINLSLGSPIEASVLGAATAYADARGAIIVAAAGNRGRDVARLDWPSAGPNALAVTALGADGRRAAFSNGRSGTFNRLRIAAPGTRLIGPHPGGTWARGGGSSFATALVSGAVARVLELDPSSDVGMARGRIATKNRLDLRRLVR